MIDIRLPEINGATSQEQLAQIRSYLYQFAGQLNWALNTLEKGQSGNDHIQVQSGGGSASTNPENDAISNFSDIKSLIIKSADIVEAYYEEIDKMISLSGKYVAKSDFADFTEETEMSLEATSEYIQQNFYKKETIDSKVSDIESEIESAVRAQEGYIRSGNVGSYWDADAIGIEIGEFDSEDEAEQKRFARFTSHGLELFGSNKEKPVAYVHQYKLYITDAEFTGKVKFGGYGVDTSNGLSIKWVGRG